MDVLTVENELRQVVSRLVTQVELATKQGKLDINLALEDALIPILKELFHLPKLHNLNAKQKNFPGIDLGDEFDRVAFQVTATTDLEKIKKTLNVFIEKNYQSNFDELYVLMLVKKQKSYSQLSIDKIIGDVFTFNTNTHVIDPGDILAKASNLRVTAQKRILHEFKLILGEIDGYLALRESTTELPRAYTTNLAPISFPNTVYVAQLTIVKKEVFERARAELGYKGRRSSDMFLCVRLALALEGSQFSAWTFHDGKLFTFSNFDDHTALMSIVDKGSIEELDSNELYDSEYVEYENVFKSLLQGQVREQVKDYCIGFDMFEKQYYFQPEDKEQISRKEKWIGLKAAQRTVFERVESKKEPGKVAHFKHLSFQLTFVKIQDQFHAMIVPSWLYTYNTHRRSRFHDKLVSKQKGLENNQAVRNLTRFVSYFLAQMDAQLGESIKFEQLIQLAPEENPLSSDENVEEEAEV